MSHFYEQYKKIKAKFITSQDEHGLYINSLIARYEDNYVVEKQIIEKATAFYPDNLYFQERQKWHSLSYFEKYEARKALVLANNYISLSEDQRSQLTIVSGGDSGVFHALYECIESIRNTTFYKDINIEILDCGLSQEHKSILQSKFHITCFHDAHSLFEQYFGFTLKDDLIDPNSYKIHTHAALVTILESFMPRYIKSNYCFYIESDIWIQDERVLDVYLRHTINHQVAMSMHDSRGPIERPLHFALRQHPYYQKVEPIHRSKAFEQAFNCYHRDYLGLQIAQKEWISYFKEHKLFADCMEFLLKNYAYRQAGFRDADLMLSHWHMYVQCPFILNQDNLIVDSKNHSLVAGSFHFARSPKDRYYNIPLSKKMQNGVVIQVERSVRYHDLPWRDKELLADIILKEPL